MTDVDLLGMTLADLQSNISISATNAVTGDIEWCTGYTQFSTDIGEQAGWYLALQVTPDVEGATVTAAYNGTIRELDNNIFIIRLADGEDTITFTANKEGYTEGRLTLDISGLDKEFINNYCYVRSLTNGITVTPLQFGESKELSGVVPYDTTTSSNKFRLSFRTFNLIPAGSEISVAHQGTPLGSGTFYIYTPQEGDGEPYSAAEIDITLTQAILDSESPTLSTTISPLDGAVTDRFYCSLNVDDVTLELSPIMRPYIDFADNITYNNVTYAQSDFTSTLGTITRNSSNNNITIDGATFKRVSLDGGATYGYYFLYTSLDNGAKTYNSEDIIGASIWTGTGGKALIQAAWDSIPSKGLFQIGDVWSTPTGSGISINATGGGKSGGVIFQNCTFENKGPTPAGRDGTFVDYSDFTYNNVNYNASDFVTGGTITRVSGRNDIVITGATFKWNPLQGETTNAYYLPLIKNNSGQMSGSAGGVTTVYAPTAKVQARSNITGNMGNFIDGTGTDAFVIKINSTDSSFNNYPMVIQNIYESSSYGTVNLELKNCTFETAPTPATPLSLYGLEIGDGPSLFQISPNYSTYYALNNDGLCCIDISYTATSVDSSNHTVYEYSATGNSTTAVGYTGMKLLQSSSSDPWFPTQNYQTSGIQNTVFLARHRNNLQTPQPLTGDFMYMVTDGNITGYTGMKCNSFVVFGVDDFTVTDYHYAYNPNTGGGGADTAYDISSKYYICCCIYGGTTSALQTDGIQIRLYNSDLSDYIVLDIDLSNVTMTTL